MVPSSEMGRRAIVAFQPDARGPRGAGFAALLPCNIRPSIVNSSHPLHTPVIISRQAGLFMNPTCPSIRSPKRWAPLPMNLFQSVMPAILQRASRGVGPPGWIPA